MKYLNIHCADIDENKVAQSWLVSSPIKGGREGWDCSEVDKINLVAVLCTGGRNSGTEWSWCCITGLM